MPISYPFKTIFVHIPKCAGTSIEKYLGMGSTAQLFSYKPIKLTDIKYDTNLFSSDELLDFENRTPQHLTITQLKKIIPNDIINSFFKFSVIRHPYQRMISEYAYIHETPTAKTSTFRNKPFDIFVDEVLNLSNEEQITLFDGHLESQFDYLFINNELAIDAVYKLENFEPCVAKLKELTKSNRDLPHSRATTFVSNIDIANETKQKIFDYYQKDFESFGYTF